MKTEDSESAGAHHTHLREHHLRHRDDASYAIDHVETELGDDGWNLLLYFRRIGTATTSAPGCPAVAPENVSIVASVKGAPALAVRALDSRRAREGILEIRVAIAGQSSEGPQRVPYHLRLQGVAEVAAGFASARFFLTDVLETDPQPPEERPPELQPEFPITYLAKDYASFLKQLLDHLSLLAPRWQERHAADTGMAVVEVLAYAADYLSYYQDAVATEAYLGTARRRVSVRRHARLLDYAANEGWNSRVWVQVQVDDAAVPLSKGTPLLTGLPGLPAVIPIDLYGGLAADSDHATFEVMHDTVLHQAHNRMTLHAHDPAARILEKGATSAALEGRFSELQPGDVLIIAQRRNDLSAAADYARTPGHAVRLIRKPVLSHDEVHDIDLTHVTWHADDALPFDLHASPDFDESNSLSWSMFGNIVLADSGRSVPAEVLPAMAASPRYYPRLRFKFLTYAAHYDPRKAATESATKALQQFPWEVAPAIMLERLPPGANEELDLPHDTRLVKAMTDPSRTWRPRPDLLRSGRFAHEFVAETEEDGTVYLRFGDGHNGARVASGSRFVAYYRINDHPDSSLDSGTIAHVVSNDGRITRVWNPLPVQRGRERETLAQVRLNASSAYRVQHSCVTEEDHVRAVKSHPEVQNAVCQIRWSGSWATAQIYVARKGGQPLTDEIIRDLKTRLELRRVADRDFVILAPQFVPLNIAFKVRADHAHPRSAVHRRLRDAFSDCLLADGRIGFFHPDRFTFGSPVYLSQLIAAAMALPGVMRIEPVRFERWNGWPSGALETGVIDIGPLEIARVKNNPAAPENGMILFHVEGGLL